MRNDALKEDVLNYTYEIIIFYQPIFEDKSLNHTNVTAIAEKHFSIDCQANGLPTPEVCAHSISMEHVSIPKVMHCRSSGHIVVK